MSFISNALNKARRKDNERLHRQGSEPELTPAGIEGGRRPSSSPEDWRSTGGTPQVSSAPPRQTEATGELPEHLRDYIYLIVKYRWWVLAVLIVVPVATAAYTLRQTPQYRATALLQINQDRVNLVDELTEGRRSRTQEFYGTHEALLQSSALARRVVEDLRLWGHPIFASHDDSAGEPSRETVDKYAGLVRRMLSARHVDGTQLIRISYAASDAELCALLANTLAQQYIAFTTEHESDLVTDTASFLQEQIGKLQEDVRAKESLLERFSTSDSRRRLVMQRLQDLNHQLTVAEADRAATRIRYQSLVDRDPSSIPEVANDVASQLTRERLQELQEKYDELTSKYQSGWPEVKQVHAAIEELRRRLARETREAVARIITTARSQYEEAEKRESVLRETLSRQEREAQELDASLVDYDRGELELDNQKRLLRELLRRQSEAGLTAALSERPPVNAGIVEEATVPRRPYKPNLRQNLMMGTVAALVLAFGLVFFLEYWNTAIVTVEDVRRYVAAPYLGMIARYRPDRRLLKNKMPGKALLSEEDSSMYLALSGASRSAPSEAHSQLTEAFKFLRTILLSAPGRSWKTLVVTGPEQGTGKTFVATNLAISLAQLDKRVLLVDADLRIPRLHRIFSAKNELGLSDLLAGEISLNNSCFQNTGITNLSLLAAGPLRSSASELLDSAALGETLHFCKEYFDHIVLDTAPLLSVPDALSVAKYCDQTILILRSERTTRQAAQATLELVHRASQEIIGAVLNDVNTTDIANLYFQTYQGSIRYVYEEDDNERMVRGRRA